MNRRTCIPLVMAMASSCAAADDVVKTGADLFQRRCSGCHAPDSDKEGPRLRGVFGRRAGSVPGFLYSDALRQTPIVWNEPLLNQWLANPASVAAGNDMEFRVTNADERAALVAYLRSLTVPPSASQPNGRPAADVHGPRRRAGLKGR